MVSGCQLWLDASRAWRSRTCNHGTMESQIFRPWIFRCISCRYDMDLTAGSLATVFTISSPCQCGSSDTAQTEEFLLYGLNGTTRNTSSQVRFSRYRPRQDVSPRVNCNCITSCYDLQIFHSVSLHRKALRRWFLFSGRKLRSCVDLGSI